MDYLLQSKTGLFKYRRRVPDSLRDLLGKREWKKGFGTRHRPTALARYATYSLQVEREIKAANEMLGKETARQSSAEAFREAVSLAQSFGVHPDQVPTLSAKATRAEIKAFPARVEEWEILMDQWHEIYPDTGPDGYMRPPETGSVKEMLQKVVSGQIESSLTPLWGEAVELYFKINAENKRRDPHTQEQFRIKTQNLLNRFITVTDHSSKSELTDFTRQDARRFLDALRDDGLKEGSVGRYSSQIGAVFNLARVEYQMPGLANPFEGLRNTKHEQEDELVRRSFTPQELNAYISELRNLPNEAITLLISYSLCMRHYWRQQVGNHSKSSTHTPATYLPTFHPLLVWTTCRSLFYMIKI